MLQTLALLACLPWMGAALTWDSTLSGVICGATINADQAGTPRTCPTTAGEPIIGTESCDAKELETWSACKAKCEQPSARAAGT